MTTLEQVTLTDAMRFLDRAFPGRCSTRYEGSEARCKSCGERQMILNGWPHGAHAKSCEWYAARRLFRRLRALVKQDRRVERRSA